VQPFARIGILSIHAMVFALRCESLGIAGYRGFIDECAG
jgi:hypothetical protein